MSIVDVTQKKIMITGAGNGLGAEMARQIAAAGAQLILTDIDESAVQKLADELTEQGCLKPLTSHQDVSSVDDWNKVYQLIESNYGALNGLVNNAGIMLHIPFPMTTLDDFKRTQDINVNSVFIGCQVMLPLLAKAGEQGASSSIVNISSIFGKVAGLMHSAYCASKGAVLMLTKSIATELPRMGMNVRCNSVHPGMMNAGVAIPAYQRLVDLGVFSSVDEAKTVIHQAIPMGRPGEAGEIPGAVAFLLSDASSLMTGTELILDGGYTAV